MVALGLTVAKADEHDSVYVGKVLAFAADFKQVENNRVYDRFRDLLNELPESAPLHLILLVDQFEEVYSQCKDDQERDAFVEILVEAAADSMGKVSVILTLRSDFLGETQRHPQLNALIASQCQIVPAMNVDELRRAISQPAIQASHPIDAETIDQLIEKTIGRDGALPLLQFVLTRIWNGLSLGVTPADTLCHLGGVGGSLAGEAQRLYGSLTVKQQHIARRAFLAMVSLGEGTQDTRRRVAVKQLVAKGEVLEEVLEVLEYFAQPERRLVTLASEESGRRIAEVSHEALFSHWRQLQDWLRDDRADIRLQRRLEEAADEWAQQKRPQGLLWRPPLLDLLGDYHGRKGHDMRTVEVEFYEASELDLRRQEREEQEREEERLKAEVDRAEERARAAKRLGRLAIVLTVVAGLAVGASLYARSQQQKAHRAASQEKEARISETKSRQLAEEKKHHAEQQAKIALSRQLAAQSLVYRVINPQRSILTALESISISKEANAFNYTRSLDLLRQHF